MKREPVLLGYLPKRLTAATGRRPAGRASFGVEVNGAGTRVPLAWGRLAYRNELPFPEINV